MNLDQAKNMNPEIMKQMTAMFAGMSDDQIRSYAQMAGMGNIDPSFFRSQAKNIEKMKSEDIKRQLDQTTPAQIEEAKRRAQFMQAQTNTTATDSFPNIQKLKEAGNKAFAQGDNELASSKYLEAIIDVEEIWSKNNYISQDQQKTKELRTLETACRLNYCNVKAKLKEFDVVKVQSLKVIAYDNQNGKANFRAGQALYELNQFKASLPYLQLASQILPQDQIIKEYIGYAQKAVAKFEEKPNQNEEDLQKQQKLDELQKLLTKEEQQAKEKQKNQPKEQEQEPEQTKKQKVKLESVDVDSQEFQIIKESVQSTLIDKEDVEIIEEPQQPKPSQTQPIRPPQPDNPGIQQSFQQFQNMSPDQMNQMANMFKTMDKGFLKNMMRQQSGVEMGDQQIEMMQNMMTPELLASMKNVDPAQIAQAQQQLKSQPAQSQFQQPPVVQQSESGQSQSQPAQFQQQASQAPTSPSIETILQNPGMITMLFEQLKQNPQMLKSMAPMIGNNAIGNYIQNATPEQIVTLIGRLGYLMKIVLAFYKVYVFLRNQWKLILGFILAYIFFKLF